MDCWRRDGGGGCLDSVNRTSTASIKCGPSFTFIHLLEGNFKIGLDIT